MKSVVRGVAFDSRIWWQITLSRISNDVSRLELADGGHPLMQGICNITMFRLPC